MLKKRRKINTSKRYVKSVDMSKPDEFGQWLEDFLMETPIAKMRDEIITLRSQLAVAVEALEYYAEKNNGYRAREALEKIGNKK